VRLPDRLYAENVRGRRIPRILGIAIVVCGGAVLAVLAPVTDDPAAAWIVGAAALLVSAAGLVDDLAPIGPRGLCGHLHALLAGRMTTGILKLLVTVGVAVVVVALLDRGDTPTRLGAVTLIAATTNVWNGLDVRPGRALKAFIALMVVLAWAGAPAPAATLGVAVFAGAVLVFIPDVREWAMLGDAGSNLLGFTAGVMLAGALPTWAIWPAAAVGVALNVVAESVTFSRVIDAAAPLRWFDRLGTRP
jgi:UDP-GlcNAc:undecaprenyl-phosphate GlcNAc-1-phosphate transferase